MDDESRTTVSRLVLGTAQLGMQYGIANKCGMPDLAQAKEIVTEANANGICIFDTAQGYERSEEVLGSCLKGILDHENISIISKLSPQINFCSMQEVVGAVEESIKKLSVSLIDGLLLHRPVQMQFWRKGGFDAICELRRLNYINKFGISMAVSLEEVITLLEYHEIEMIQIPFNIWDKSAMNCGLIKAATLLKKQIFIRSVFLQGLAFMREDEIPTKLYSRLHPLLKAARDFCHKKGYPVPHFCLQYALARIPNAKILFGAETKKQVSTNIIYAMTNIPLQDLTNGIQDIVSPTGTL